MHRVAGLAAHTDQDPHRAEGECLGEVAAEDLFTGYTPPASGLDEYFGPTAATQPLFARVLEGLRLLEDDALGGGGSRGSGRVRLANLRLVWRGRGFYAAGEAEQELVAGGELSAMQSLAAGDLAEKLV